jgi:hypothetical protein
MKTILIKGIPVELYRRFKAVCAARGRTMKEVFIELMERFCG